MMKMTIDQQELVANTLRERGLADLIMRGIDLFGRPSWFGEYDEFMGYDYQLKKWINLYNTYQESDLNEAFSIHFRYSKDKSYPAASVMEEYLKRINAKPKKDNTKTSVSEAASLPAECLKVYDEATLFFHVAQELYTERSILRKDLTDEARLKEELNKYNLTRLRKSKGKFREIANKWYNKLSPAVKERYKNIEEIMLACYAGGAMDKLIEYCLCKEMS